MGELRTASGCYVFKQEGIQQSPTLVKSLGGKKWVSPHLPLWTPPQGGCGSGSAIRGTRPRASPQPSPVFLRPPFLLRFGKLDQKEIHCWSEKRKALLWGKMLQIACPRSGVFVFVIRKCSRVSVAHCGRLALAFICPECESWNEHPR